MDVEVRGHLGLDCPEELHVPITFGSPGRRTRDYRRHGTTSLLAAFDVATSRITGECHLRDRRHKCSTGAVRSRARI